MHSEFFQQKTQNRKNRLYTGEKTGIKTGSSPFRLLFDAKHFQYNFSKKLRSDVFVFLGGTSCRFTYRHKIGINNKQEERWRHQNWKGWKNAFKIEYVKVKKYIHFSLFLSKRFWIFKKCVIIRKTQTSNDSGFPRRPQRCFLASGSPMWFLFCENNKT